MKNLLSYSLFIIFMIFLVISTKNVSDNNNLESQKVILNAVNKSVTECYAVEGYYPPNIEYLEDNYGLAYNRSKYIVHYEIFASNIYPDIKIIEMDGN